MLMGLFDGARINGRIEIFDFQGDKEMRSRMGIIFMHPA